MSVALHAQEVRAARSTQHAEHSTQQHSLTADVAASSPLNSESRMRLLLVILADPVQTMVSEFVLFHSLHWDPSLVAVQSGTASVRLWLPPSKLTPEWSEAHCIHPHNSGHMRVSPGHPLASLPFQQPLADDFPCPFFLSNNYWAD